MKLALAPIDLASANEFVRRVHRHHGPVVGHKFSLAAMRGGHLACVCAVNRNHKTYCPFRRAVTVPIGIECEHGRDVCPVCDPCTCEPRT